MSGEAKSRVIVAGRDVGGNVRDVLVGLDGSLQTAGGVGGGGGPATIIDGGDVAQGSVADVAWVGGAAPGSLIAISKAEYAKLEAIRALLASSLAVTGPLTDAQLRAASVLVSGPLTDTQLRASAVPVSGTFFQGTQPVSGPLTDTQLRASAVPVDVSDRAARLLGHVTVDTAPTTAVTGPLTDAQLRASAVPVSGPLTDAQLRASVVPVSGPLTDAQLRATAVPVNPQPTGATNVLKTGTITSTAVTADQVVLTYMVTAGKTFYLTYIVMYGRLTVLAATATILGAISLETPSGTKVLTLDDVNPTTSELEFNPIVLPTPIPIAAGVVVRVVVTPAAATSMLWRANFGGYEK